HFSSKKLLQSRGQLVVQTCGVVTATGGQLIVFYCSYEAQIGGSHYPYWYIQHSGQPLKLFLLWHEKNVQGFHGTVHKGKTYGTFNLQKDASQLKGSAAYFCAFTNRKGTRGVGGEKSSEANMTGGEILGAEVHKS
uniref:Immunoglobulin V-set domain-containing protein n=1 Tax=Laticauda laticaudata TaxID=8630 RepID=A0A8C5STF9_LATLA